MEGFAMATKNLLMATATESPVEPTTTVLPDPPKYEQVGDSGKTVLWIVFLVMLVSSAIFTLLGWSVPLGKRLYHTVTTMITIIAAISYFSMATGGAVGWHHVLLKHKHDQGLPDTHQDLYRQVFWGRYVDWALTTPLLLLDLGLLAGMSGGHILMAIAADVIMVLTGLFAAFPDTKSQKWGWYTISCVAFLVIIWHLAVNGRRAASAHGAVGKLYTSLAVYTALIWTAYPIVWGLSEGGRVISVDAEVIVYAILDILAKPVFGFWLLFAHRSMSDSNLEVGGFWTHGVAREGAVRLEDDDGA
jgi:bacteriorhodopsin